MTTSVDVRNQLINALRMDLLGPQPGNPEHLQYEGEVLPIAPSRWYLTGFLVPYEAPADQRTDDDGDDELDQLDRVAEGDDENTPEKASARKAFFPSSMGLSVLVPAGLDELRVEVVWGDYAPVPVSDGSAGDEGDSSHDPAAERAGGGRWRRLPRSSELVVQLSEGDPTEYEVPDSAGLRVVVSTRPTNSKGMLPAGTRSVSVFLVNHRDSTDLFRDAGYVFQPEIELHATEPFVPRPDLRGRDGDDWDDKVADVQYRDVFEYAVGHNVSAVAVVDSASECSVARTCWMPTADVEKVIPAALPEVELGMEALAEAQSADDVRALIGPMIAEYGTWLAKQSEVSLSDPKRAQVVEDLLENAGKTRVRIQAGLDVLDDEQALEAFRLTNRAIATAFRQRKCHDAGDLRPEDVQPPSWYPFQLAFLLMNLAGIADPAHHDRKVVDLLFFPTGGGKTEAYLGLAAFTMLLRRLRDPSIQSSGLSVIMRYTLRLLTLDQLGRAATLVCALELLRQKDVEKLGLWPFEIGLWVGQSATPNRMGAKGKDNEYSARRRTIAFQNDTRRKPSPIPLENCPWCGTKFTRDSFQLLPDPNAPTDLRVVCASPACDFFSRRQDRGLPILSVDEPIYRRLPAFIIAPVDKFAGLPWVGETAGFFGRVSRYDDNGFYGPSHKGVGKPLDGALPPPALIIQDELHLISGPLGTMVGMYETAIDALCSDPVGVEGVRPKIVASTATVRRAEKQIRGLFGRTMVNIFPPPGPDRRTSFFAETVDASKRNPRTYVGIAAQGRNLKVVLLRSYLALLGAGLKAWRDNGGSRNPKNPADPYMTLLGYFNALRELGGSRRIVEDEVRSRLSDYGFRRRRIGQSRGLFVDRKKLHDPRELTSRVSTNEVADTKRRLDLTYHDRKERLDVALATNMISVGLDISRLGLMVVLGQPKTASEYIQATSRVGRDDKRPGLVVTLLNVHRPRDRSHYERFAAWHESFYRAVEATSVTPFSPRAVDRGLAGVSVALARLGHEAMTAPLGASDIAKYREELAYVAEVISRRAEGHDADLSAAESEALRKNILGRVNGLLDTWASIAAKEGDLQYAVLRSSFSRKWELVGDVVATGFHRLFMKTVNR